MATSMRPSSFNISFFNEALAIKNFDGTKTRPIGYARLSFDEDGDNYCSIINQSDIIKDYGKKNLSDLQDTIEVEPDDDVSGYSFDRPGLYKILDQIEQGKCNIIIAKDLSRIGRHNALTQLFIEQCERIGIRVIAIDDYDSNKKSDEVILGIRTWSNERVVKDASSKILKVVDHKQKNGTWLCAVPFGYKVADFQNPVIEVDEVAAKIVRQIFELYDSGVGMKKICITLSEEGVITPSAHIKNTAISEGKTIKRIPSKRWAIAQVAKILSDEFYIGTLRTNKYARRGINGPDVRLPESEHNVFEDHHEPIITKDLFDSVQTKRKTRRETHYRGTKKHDNIFHGVLRCRDCGQVLFSFRRDGLDPQYVCSTYFRFNKHACTRHMIKEKTLIQIATNYLKMIKEKSESILKSLDNDLMRVRRSQRTDTETISKLVKNVETLTHELETIESQRIKQIILHPEREASINSIYDAMYEKTEGQIQITNDKITQLKNISIESVEAQKKVKASIDIINHIIETGEITRRDVESIFKEIVVHEDGTVEVELLPDVGFISTDKHSVVDKAKNHLPKTYAVIENSVNDIHSGDPLETTFTRKIAFVNALYSMSTTIRR